MRPGRNGRAGVAARALRQAGVQRGLALLAQRDDRAALLTEALGLCQDDCP